MHLVKPYDIDFLTGNELFNKKAADYTLMPCDCITVAEAGEYSGVLCLRCLSQW